MKIHTPLIAILAFGSLALASSAHELWIGSNRYMLHYPNPRQDNLDEGSPVFITLYIGYAHRMSVDELWPKRYFGGIYLAGPDGKLVRTDATEDGVQSVQYEVKAPGTYIATTSSINCFVMHTRNAAGKRFTTWISKLDPVPEGLTPVPDSSEDNRQFGKTIINVFGKGKTDGYATKPIGIEFEIVPTKNPVFVQVGESLTAQVLLKGKPYTEEPLEVVADNMGGPYIGGAGRWSGPTDREGRVTIPITLPGVWKLVTTVYIPAEGELAKKVDKTRYRTCLSFEIPGLVPTWEVFKPTNFTLNR